MLQTSSWVAAGYCCSALDMMRELDQDAAPRALPALVQGMIQHAAQKRQLPPLDSALGCNIYSVTHSCQKSAGWPRAHKQLRLQSTQCSLVQVLAVDLARGLMNMAELNL